MTHINTSNEKLSKMAKAAGMFLLVMFLFSVGAPEAEAIWRIKSDWSKVEAVTPGTRATVVLYKDLAPRGKRKIKGYFHSSTAESITLMLGHGQTRTVEKGDVRRVLVPRPLKKRYQGWVALAVSTALIAPLLPGADLTAWGIAYVVGLHIPIPTAFTFLVAPKMGGIYNVPRGRRSDTAQSTPKRKMP